MQPQGSWATCSAVYTLLNLQCFSNPRLPSFFYVLCPQMWWIMATVSLWQPVHRIASYRIALRSHTGKPKKVGGAINRSLISTHFSISIYFLTVQTNKRMRLTTRVYGICIIHGIFFLSAIVLNASYGKTSNSQSKSTLRYMHGKVTGYLINT